MRKAIWDLIIKYNFDLVKIQDESEEAKGNKGNGSGSDKFKNRTLQLDPAIQNDDRDR